MSNIHVAFALGLAAPMPEGAELERAVKQASARFDTLIDVHCDIDAVADMLDPDFRMLHDREGITDGKEAFLAIIVESCADADSHPPQRYHFAPSTHRVQALGTWGALETGDVSFFRLEGGEWRLFGGSSAVQVWRWDGETFRLVEMISADHRDVPPEQAD